MYPEIERSEATSNKVQEAVRPFWIEKVEGGTESFPLFGAHFGVQGP